MSSETFVVSGAASGIGRHMACALHAAGKSLALTDINMEGLQALSEQQGWADDPRVMLRELDARDADGWQKLIDDTVDRFGDLDVLMNVAGYLKPGNAHETERSEIDRHMDINAKGVMYATHAASRVMVRAGRGHIINIASLAGISHIPGLSAYCASKHAVRGYSLATAHELRAHGVQVTVVCPDAVETPMLELQQDYPEAALTFSGGRGLTLREVEAALWRVLQERPLECVIDLPRSGRGVTARLSNLFPRLTLLAVGRLRARGRSVQAGRT